MTTSKLVFCFLGVASCWSHEPLCAQTETELLSVRSAINRFEILNGRYPASLSELLASGEVEPESLTDAWDHHLAYKVTPTGYDLRSAGQDGVLGTADDQTPVSGWSTCQAGCAVR